MIKDKETTSTKYLFRPLGIIKKEELLSTSRMKDFGFINAFIKDVNHEIAYERPLYLLFKQNPPLLSFRQFIQEEYERGYLLEDYDYPDGYIVLVYSYPEELSDDYDKILAGKYSETSKKYQDCFPTTITVNGKQEPGIHHLVFNKHPSIREAIEKEYDVQLPEGSEVRTLPILEKETLNIRDYVHE